MILQPVRHETNIIGPMKALVKSSKISRQQCTFKRQRVNVVVCHHCCCRRRHHHHHHHHHEQQSNHKRVIRVRYGHLVI